MNINGNKIKSMISILKNEIASYRIMFEKGTRYFKGEPRPDINPIAEKLMKLTTDFATVKTAQNIYNTTIKIKIESFGHDITIQEAFELLDVYETMNRLYKEAIDIDYFDNFRSEFETKKKDDLVALYTLSDSEVHIKSKEFEIIKQNIINAIAEADLQYLDIKILDRFNEV